MKPQWQQQQAQLRQRQMAAAWLEKQKANQPPAGPTSGQDPFIQVEQAAASLRLQVSNGTITAEQAREQMQELMVQDDKGTWWTVGFETGNWYRYTGDAWVIGRPPRKPVTAAQRQQSKSHPVWALILLLAGLALTAGAGLLAGSLTYNLLYLGDTASWVAAIAAWLGGLVMTAKLTRKVWRGR